MSEIRYVRADGDKRPAPYMVRELRNRHEISRQQLSDSLYGVSVRQIETWESDSRNGRRCPAAIWWQMVFVWDKVDLWELYR